MNQMLMIKIIVLCIDLVFLVFSMLYSLFGLVHGINVLAVCICAFRFSFCSLFDV